MAHHDELSQAVVDMILAFSCINEPVNIHSAINLFLIASVMNANLAVS